MHLRLHNMFECEFYFCAKYVGSINNTHLSVSYSFNTQEFTVEGQFVQCSWLGSIWGFIHLVHTQIFGNFLPPDWYTYVCQSGGKKY